MATDTGKDDAALCRSQQHPPPEKKKKKQVSLSQGVKDRRNMTTTISSRDVQLLRRSEHRFRRANVQT